MAVYRSGVLTWLVLGSALASGQTVELREQSAPGQITRLVVGLQAEGQSKLAVPEGKPGSRPTPLKVQGRFDVWERVMEVDGSGRPRKVMRQARQAAAAINNGSRPVTSSLRAEVALLVAERREGGVVTYSPSGPLTRQELEVIQWPADALTLPGLLPDRPVALGDHWEIGADGARSISGYDALASNTLKGTLEALDDATARIKLAGLVRGATLGAEGMVNCEATLTFDRKANLVQKLDLRRHEIRKPGQVEAGLDVRSTVNVARSLGEAPPELTDAAVAGLTLTANPALELLRFTPPGGQYSLIHDRNWHIFYADERQTVLKWLDHGELIAQCNLALGPSAGKGKHQEPAQFQEDIRRALGKRFGKFLFAGPLAEPADGLFRFRVAVQGQEDAIEVIRIYYLVANPEGEQLLVNYTLGGAQAARFGEQDLGMITTLSWPVATGSEPTKAK